jgi:tetratricopeptide (TPR) repeat protein
MKFSYRAFAFLIMLCGLFAASLLSFKTQSQTTMEPRRSAPAVTPAAREEAYRENNRGVAMLEQYNHKEAAEAFRRALKIDPTLKVGLINLAVALYNVPDLEKPHAPPPLPPKARRNHRSLTTSPDSSPKHRTARMMRSRFLARACD